MKKAISILLTLLVLTACSQSIPKAESPPESSPESPTASPPGSLTTSSPESSAISETSKTPITAPDLPSLTAEQTGEFAPSAANFTVEAFKRAYAEKAGRNCMVSPLSVMLALSMTANGANGETLAEIEKMFGMNMSDLNESVSAYADSLPSAGKTKLNVANSIWYRDRLTVLDGFLDVNKRYYGAAVQKSAFDGKTLAEINNWVKDNTDGMIDKIIDEIPNEAVMYLINAIAFDGKWEEEYEERQVRESNFYAYDGSTQTAEMMYSGENIYIEDNYAAGFIKPYKGGNYSFAALLPNEGVSIDEYAAGLTGESLLKTLGNRSYEEVSAGLPKFKSDYGIEMSSLLKAMGVKAAFDETAADFSKLGTSPNGNIYISEVLHKTFIEVDEKGTKAAAVTAVAARDNAMHIVKTVVLDRPFVYAIIDNSTNLPIFIGVLTSVN